MTIQVIDRAVRILRVVARRGASSLTEISTETRLPVPTTARILKSLADNGIVRRLDDKTYNLGARLLPISTRLESFRKSFELAHPTIEELSHVTREDCGLAVLQGNEAVVVDWCYGPHSPRIIEPYSREIPLYCAFGKVLIAFQPAQWRNRFLQNAMLRKMAAGTVPKGGEEWDMPIMNVFRRHGSVIRHFWGSELLYVPPEPGQEYRHNDLLDPLWNVFDLAPEGRGDFQPKLAYASGSRQ